MRTSEGNHHGAQQVKMLWSMARLRPRRFPLLVQDGVCKLWYFDGIRNFPQTWAFCWSVKMRQIPKSRLEMTWNLYYTACVFVVFWVCSIEKFCPLLIHRDRYQNIAFRGVSTGAFRGTQEEQSLNTPHGPIMHSRKLMYNYVCTFRWVRIFLNGCI